MANSRAGVGWEGAWWCARIELGNDVDALVDVEIYGGGNKDIDDDEMEEETSVVVVDDVASSIDIAIGVAIDGEGDCGVGDPVVDA